MQSLNKYKFSKLSLERLSTCHILLQNLMKYVMEQQIMDFSILCGHRGKEAQNEAVREGHSLLCYPHGRHNNVPSLAVDIAAYPIDNFNHSNTVRTRRLACLVKRTAKLKKIPVFWGGDWTHFVDIYHFQLPEFYANEYAAKDSLHTQDLNKKADAVLKRGDKLLKRD